MLSRTSSLAAAAGSFASATSTASAASSPALRPRQPFPRISWLHECWLNTCNPYERIATGSPRIGVGILGYHLVEQHINMLPTLASPADFVPVYGAAAGTAAPPSTPTDRTESRGFIGRFVGVRPKLATWPLNKQEVQRSKEW